ncbi:MAG: transcription elongation factor GreA [Armatimonadota bacterium]
MANDFQVTAAGLSKMKAELDELKGATRMVVAQAIREAKSHGDLRENAAYHEAKLNQTRLDLRISELENAIQRARVIERTGEGAGLGATVKLLDLEYEEELEITLVGAFESDPANGLVSVSSPLGEAVQNRLVGETIEVLAPAGLERFRILEIKG